jgi:nucleoside-diphosphate-sugar epimerase
MKLLITGVGGFVGAAVAKAAIAAGHEVVGTIRVSGNMERIARLRQVITLVELDLRDVKAVSLAVAAHAPEAIIHVAWSGINKRMRSARLQITDNIESSCALLEAGIASGIEKFVGLGSQGEYGPLISKISERDLPQPSSLYGAAKLSVMHLTRELASQAGVSFTWLRLFSAYGPRDNPACFIPALIESILNGQSPRTTLGTQRWDYLYIDDVASGVLAATVDSKASGIFNLGSGQPVQIREIIESIRDRIAPSMELKLGELPYPPDQIWHMEADISRLTTTTGWRPRIDLAAGLDQTIAWHRRRREALSMSVSNGGPHV